MKATIDHTKTSIETNGCPICGGFSFDELSDGICCTSCGRRATVGSYQNDHYIDWSCKAEHHVVAYENTDRDESLARQIKDFAEEYPRGFTLDTRSRRLHDADRGYVVAVYSADTTKENIPEILKLAKRHNLHLIGGWWDAKEERYEFDACCWFEDCSEAVKFAKEQKQKAIYDCDTGFVLDLKLNLLD